MKIRILSDLHIDVSKFELKPLGEDLLILAGDISNKPEDTFNIVKNYMTNSEENSVIFILGNHDYYNDTIIDRIKYWKHFGKQLGSNFHFLNQSSVIINSKDSSLSSGIEFYGTTLWSNVDLSNNTNNRFKLYKDFKHIRKNSIYDRITPLDYINLYNQDIVKLNEFLDSKSDFKRIIITHHLPSYKSVSEKYKYNPFNDFFASNLDNLVLKHTESIKLWIHGHTHSSFDYNIGNTRILCNPRGYIDENTEFKHDLIVEL